MATTTSPQSFSDPPEAPQEAPAKYAPCATYEDGTMMFTAEALQEVNYEDVLAP